MTETAQRICDELTTSHKKIKIFWDMDGTCASMEMQKKEQKLEKGFFKSKRPIKTIISLMKLFHTLGAENYILSFCGYYYQKEDKIDWLKNNCDFIDLNNIIIIPRKEPDVKPANSKQELKAEYIKDYILPNEIVYMIDDNESVLLGTKEKLPFVNIISPIDFID